MTEEEIKNKISEHKECCKKLAEEYRQRYNEDNTDKLALNMFYHNVISYNDFETVLAIIEDRNSMIMCFSKPPHLTEETVEVNIKRIAELEKENAELKHTTATLRQEKDNVSMHANAMEVVAKTRSDQLTKAKEIIKTFLGFAEAFGYSPSMDKFISDTEQFLSEVEK